MWMDLETVVQSEVKSEREKQIPYSSTCMWNLAKWYRWTYLQSRNTDTDVEKECKDTGVGGSGVGMNWEIEIEIDTCYTTRCKTDKCRGHAVEHGELYSGLCGDPNGKEIQKRGDTRIRMADSLCRWLIHFAVEQKLTQLCRATKHQLKKKNHRMDLVCVCFFFFFPHLEWQFSCGVSTALDGTGKGKRKKKPHVKFRVLLFSFAYTIPHRWCGWLIFNSVFVWMNQTGQLLG